MTRTAALKHLKKVDPRLYAATRSHHASLPDRLPRKRTRGALFASLISSTVVSQQLGLAAAAAILSRVKKACGGRLSVSSVLKVRPAALRTAGLSGSKVKTISTIAVAIKNKKLDLLSLRRISEAEAAEALMRMWGLGPWSVEMFMMFALGRGDVFSPGDLGLARAMEALYSLPKGASRKKLLTIAQIWSPHRTYASLLLWASRDKT